MRIIRRIKRLKRRFIESIYSSKYKIKGRINIFGRVSIDNDNIKFGNNVSLYDGVQIWGNGEIIIGNNVSIGKDTIIFSKSRITIGDDTLISGQCYIIDSDHGIKKNKLIRLQEQESVEIDIGHDVWIGAGVKILKGVKISNGTVIGANSLVNKNTDDYSINVGSPSRKIGVRD